MRIVFIGSGAFALPTLRWLARSGHEVRFVLTQPARPSGRGRKVAPTPVRALADELGLAVLEAEDINARPIVERLRSTGARLGVVVAFGQKLGPDVLAAAPAGCVNLHASLLPRFRGAAPINAAILRGEERTGCTVFRVIQRMDAGPILATRWTLIKPEETAGELHDRLAAIGVDAVRAALTQFEGEGLPEGTPQDEDEATYAPKLRKSDGFVRFDRCAVDVANHICGMTPWPGAAARFHGGGGRREQVNIIRARPVAHVAPPAAPPGTIDERRYVAADDGFVEILEIQPPSGRVMTWADYVNGRHVAPGDRFVTPET